MPVYASGHWPTSTYLNSGLVSSADLNSLAVLGRANGDGVAGLPMNRFPWIGLQPRVWPSRAQPTGGLAARPLIGVLVATDGSTAAIERVRTVLEANLAHGILPAAIDEMISSDWAQMRLLRRLVDVGIVLSLIIAGCSLAVAVAGSLVERKRSFGMLRLAGTPLARLRRVVMLEAAVPLALVAVASAAAGIAAAGLILHVLHGHGGLYMPPPGYFALVGGGLAAALGVVAATLPLLGRLTAPESVRLE
jgi:hypothetical protein